MIRDGQKKISIEKCITLLSFDWDDREQYDKNKRNGCLCDSKERKQNKMVSYFSQLIPEAYLTTPLLLPFPPKSHSVLGANAIHGFTKDERLISHILPKECCWFARTGHAIARIPDGFVVSLTLNFNYHFQTILNFDISRINCQLVIFFEYCC